MPKYKAPYHLKYWFELYHFNLQIEENMKQKENQKLKINLDLLNDNEVNNAEDDFVELETMRMKNQGFQEQVFKIILKLFYMIIISNNEFIILQI